MSDCAMHPGVALREAYGDLWCSACEAEIDDRNQEHEFKLGQIEERKQRIAAIEIENGKGLKVSMSGQYILAHVRGDIIDVEDFSIAIEYRPLSHKRLGHRAVCTFMVKKSNPILSYLNRLDPQDKDATLVLFVATSDDSFACILPKVYITEMQPAFDGLHYAGLNIGPFETYDDGYYEADLLESLK